MAQFENTIYILGGFNNSLILQDRRNNGVSNRPTSGKELPGKERGVIRNGEEGKN